MWYSVDPRSFFLDGNKDSILILYKYEIFKTPEATLAYIKDYEIRSDEIGLILSNGNNWPKGWLWTTNPFDNTECVHNVSLSEECKTCTDIKIVDRKNYRQKPRCNHTLEQHDVELGWTCEGMPIDALHPTYGD